MTATVEDLDTPAVLLQAADLLQTDGWCQKRMRRSDGSRCLDKALMDASNRVAEYEGAIEALAAHLQLVWRDSVFLAVQRWNDQPWVTEAHVLAALRETAEAVTAR